MAYNPIYNKPYPDGWQDKPDETTPVTAEILDSYDTTFEHIEGYLRDQKRCPKFFPNWSKTDVIDVILGRTIADPQFVPGDVISIKDSDTILLIDTVTDYFTDYDSSIDYFEIDHYKYLGWWGYVPNSIGHKSVKVFRGSTASVVYELTTNPDMEVGTILASDNNIFARIIIVAKSKNSTPYTYTSEENFQRAFGMGSSAIIGYYTVILLTPYVYGGTQAFNLPGLVNPSTENFLIADLGKMSLKPASASTLGGVKVDGSTIKADADGTIHAEISESSTAQVFDDELSMDAWLKDEDNKEILSVGDLLLIKEVDVPDFWVTEVLEEADLEGYFYHVSELETKIGLTGYLKNTDDTKDNVTNFADAENRENLVTGETHATLFSKIKKWFSDMKTIAFTGSYNDATDRPSINNVELVGNKTAEELGIVVPEATAFNRANVNGDEISATADDKELRFVDSDSVEFSVDSCEEYYILKTSNITPADVEDDEPPIGGHEEQPTVYRVTIEHISGNGAGITSLSLRTVSGVSAVNLSLDSLPYSEDFEDPTKKSDVRLTINGTPAYDELDDYYSTVYRLILYGKRAKPRAITAKTKEQPMNILNTKEEILANTETGYLADALVVKQIISNMPTPGVIPENPTDTTNLNIWIETS